MNVLIADKFETAGIDALKTLGCRVVCKPQLDGDALRAALAAEAFELLIVRSTKVTSPMLSAAPTLKMVIRAGAGCDTIDVPTATRRGVAVCNCPGMNSVAVAELTLGLMIALDRRIVDETDDLRRGIWNKKEYSKARGLKGRTLGIVGLGRIGYEVAKRAQAFEMELVYHDEVTRPDVEAELGITKVPFETLLEMSDFVTLHVPGGTETSHLIGSAELAMMKPTAFLINCSRGGIVHEQALADALSGGKLAGAALDVYEMEPAATEYEFKDAIAHVPHVYGTHHVGASTEQAQCAIADEVVRIVQTYLRDGATLNCVNPPAAVKA